MMQEEQIDIFCQWDSLVFSFDNGNDEDGFKFMRDELKVGMNLTVEAGIDTKACPSVIIDSIDDEGVKFHVAGNKQAMRATISDIAEIDVDAAGVIIVELSASKVNLREWDETAKRFYEFEIDIDDWYDMAEDEDADAAFRVAQSMLKQQPEAIGIVSEYMDMAASMGNDEADAWLASH